MQRKTTEGHKMKNNVPMCGKCSTRINKNSPNIIRIDEDGTRTEYHWDCGERAYSETLGVEAGLKWLWERRYLSHRQPSLFKG